VLLELRHLEEVGVAVHVEKQLQAAGVPVSRRTPYSLFVRDPEGNRVALTHWPEEA
jgi:extradiol dioxygenase family protein